MIRKLAAFNLSAFQQLSFVTNAVRKVHQTTTHVDDLAVVLIMH